jgi:type III secretion system YscD/HrpQ family protein
VAIVAVLAMIPQKKRLTPVDLEKILQAQVADMNYYPAITVHLDHGQIIVEGYIPTNLESRELRGALLETYSGIQYQVRSNEKITDGIEEMLRAVPGNLKVSTVEPGTYSVSGYIFNLEQWQKVNPRLLTDVPGVKKMQNDVTTPEKIITLSQATLNQYGLGRNISVTPEFGRVLYQGKISVLQADQWKRAVDDLVQTFAALIPLEFDVQTYSAQTETANTAFFPQPIQSITISSSGLSWVATSDGKKYFIGSFLPSGWRVDAITIDGLALSKEGKQVNMRLEALK